MASRKTYFGIGWPKDPSDAVPGASSTREPEDRSAPTVVDDEKVAEGLKQLRSWYQGDAQQEQNRADSAVPVPYAPQGSGSTGSHARPTAVGHASGSPPAMPRPMAPDPMRATMYGHDVHQFEFPPGPGDATPTPQQPPPPAAVSTALVVADPAARPREMFRQQAETGPGPVGRSTQEPFPMARLGEAQRLVRPGGYRPTPYPPPSTGPRVPLTSKIVFAAGIAAFTGAVLIWLLSGNDPVTASAPPAPPAPVFQTPPAPTPMRTTTATTTATAPAPIPARTSTPAVQTPAFPARTAIAPTRPTASPSSRAPRATPEPIPLVTEPKTDRPAKVRRPKAIEIEKPATDEDAATTAVAASSQTDREPGATDAKDPRALKEAKETKETKEVKAPKESKEAKAAKEPKSRAGDADAPLPPSSLD